MSSFAELLFVSFSNLINELNGFNYQKAHMTSFFLVVVVVIKAVKRDFLSRISSEFFSLIFRIQKQSFLIYFSTVEHYLETAFELTLGAMDLRQGEGKRKLFLRLG
jgi:hypothetical protein